MAGSSSNFEFRSLSRDAVGVTAGLRKGEWSEETPLSLLESPEDLVYSLTKSILHGWNVAVQKGCDYKPENSGDMMSNHSE